MRLDHITPKQFDVCVSDGEVDKPKICKNSQTNHIPNSGKRLNRDFPTELLDDHRALEPPDPIPNSAVKRRIADGSVGFPHVRVGHRQAPIPNPQSEQSGWGFVFAREKHSDTGIADNEAAEAATGRRLDIGHPVRSPRSLRCPGSAATNQTHSDSPLPNAFQASSEHLWH